MTNFGGEASALTAGGGVRLFIKSKTYGTIELTDEILSTTNFLSSCEVLHFNGQSLQLKFNMCFELSEHDEVVLSIGTTLSNTTLFNVRVLGHEAV